MIPRGLTVATKCHFISSGRCKLNFDGPFLTHPQLFACSMIGMRLERCNSCFVLVGTPILPFHRLSRCRCTRVGSLKTTCSKGFKLCCDRLYHVFIGGGILAVSEDFELALSHLYQYCVAITSSTEDRTGLCLFVCAMAQHQRL